MAEETENREILRTWSKIERALLYTGMTLFAAGATSIAVGMPLVYKFVQLNPDEVAKPYLIWGLAGAITGTALMAVSEYFKERAPYWVEDERPAQESASSGKQKTNVPSQEDIDKTKAIARKKGFVRT